MLVEVGLYLLEDLWNKVKVCVCCFERRIYVGILLFVYSINIDRFCWVDKCCFD